MSQEMNRRDLLALMGIGGVVFASGLAACAANAAAGPRMAGAPPLPPPPPSDDFFFLQLSDTHWGFKGPPNPQADVTLEHAIATLNAVEAQPDFIVFTGDLTHTTDDAAERKARLGRVKEIASTLKVKNVRFLPGEHDAAPDHGDAYREAFGDLHYSFDHKGVHFVALDNVSDKEGAVGAAQIDWLSADLKKAGRDRRIVVLTHRPLFDLYPQWEWATKDGSKVIDVLMPYKHVTVFYGHIHQEHHHDTEHIAHNAARSLVFSLPAPGSVPKKAPLPFDAAAPFAGLGYRQVDVRGPEVSLTELPVVKSAT